MTLMLVSGPATEPVTLDEVRAHLRVESTDEDVMLGAFITAARVTLEAQTRRAFVTQNWKLILDGWSGATVSMPLAPVSAVMSVTLNDPDGTRVVVSSHYDLALQGDAPRIVAVAAWPRPLRRVGGIEIDFTAGYGAAGDVPAPLRQAILMLVAHWFEHREPVSLGETVEELPMTVANLIAPYRRVHL